MGRTPTRRSKTIVSPPPPAAQRISEPKPSRTRRGEPMLMEIAWEVCNQLGGIYTVLRSKVPSMVSRWGTRYCLVGPYNPATAQIEFEPQSLSGPVGQAVKQLRDAGIGAHYGKWLVTGRPHVVLLNYLDVFPRLHEVKYKLWTNHGIRLPANDEWVNNTVAFGECVRMLLSALAHKESARRPVLAHFHEWMAGAAIPMLRHEKWPGSIVFTTHATILGRYLAMNDQNFYDKLSTYDPGKEATRFNIEPQFMIERAAAHGSQVFTTVSDVTAQECTHLLGRTPDVLLPNGLNIQRFTALHEFQNLHRTYKEKIHNFTIGHFFPSYHFDLDKTLYFYTSGRYEYRNKGMDLTIEALARLNHRLRVTGSGQTVVAFIITKRPVKSINVTALQSSAMRDEIRTSAEALAESLKEQLFQSVASGKIPDLNAMVDEYWLLRLKRTMLAWKRDFPPGVLTHDLVHEQDDEVLAKLRECRLWNQSHDPVKVVYHPDFITASNPLFGMDYDQFVRGCHMGIFPSYYEPWGYTPLESIALGVPAITSDLSGFGSYLLQLMPNHQEEGMYVLKRQHRSFDEVANDLTDRLFAYTQLNRRERIEMRASVESCSEHFDWHNLGERYHEAHELAMDRLGE